MGVDTLGGPGSKYNFIRDKELMLTMQPLDDPVEIRGVGTLTVHNIGTAVFRAAGEVFVLGNCLFDPELPSNIVNVWRWEQLGGDFEFKQRRLVSKTGTIIEVGHDTLHFDVMPVDVGELPADTLVQVCSVETVQRGTGPLHVDAKAMDGKERAMFELNMARMNDPSLGRALGMHNIADGVHKVLQKANSVNTVTDARMLADPPASPPKAGTTPVAERPGQLTQTDWWSGPCVSIIGNKGMFCFYDSHSTNIVFYPAKSKAVAPQATDTYFLNCKARGVNFDKGGVLWSDNEIVLNSRAMDDVAARHGQARGNAIEYKPTGNSGAESTFRIGGHEMRKSLIRAGLPDEFWDFAIMDAQVLLEATRERDGVAVGTKFDGLRRGLASRRVFGSKVIAKKFPTWVRSKADDRGVMGINLGRARAQPGWWIWTPDFGVFPSDDVTFFETVFPFKDGTFKLAARKHQSAGGGGAGIDMTAAAAPALPAWNHDDDGGSAGGSEAPRSERNTPATALRAQHSVDGSGDDGVGSAGGSEAQSSEHPDEVGSAGGSVHSGPGVGLGLDAALQAAGLLDGSDDDSDDDEPYDETIGMADDPSDNSSSAEWSASGNEPGHTHLNKIDVVELMAAAVKVLKKKKRDQDATGIPPPWMGLNNAPERIKQVFMEAEMKEINGILDVGAAYEALHKYLPAGTKVYKTLTIRDTKKNGPKKGQAKVRVCVDRGPQNVESHSPTIQMATLRALLALLAAKKAKGKAGDFPQAYLNADQELYYVWPPLTARQYDEQGNRLVWALPKALYGGRASGRHWYKMLRNWFVANGFVVSEWDPCLFVKVTEDGNFHYVGVYVDDLIHVYSDEAAYEKVVTKFRESFHGYSDLGALSEIFNAEIDVDEHHVTLTQTRYIELLQEKFLVGEVVSKTYTPALVELEEAVKKAAERKTSELSTEDHAKYREIVGAILYIATVCRPDIAVAVGLLSRVLEYPDADTLFAAYRTLRYLITTKVLGLRWTVGGDTTLSGMSDSNWAVVKSTSGYVFFLCHAAIAYIAKKQASIAMSSTEAEIMAAALAALEAVFLRGILAELQCLQSKPTVLGVDNQGAIALAKSYISNSRTKHIERRHLKIRELVEEMVVRPEFVPTDENVADIMSKPLGRVKFEKFRKVLLNHEV